MKVLSICVSIVFSIVLSLVSLLVFSLVLSIAQNAEVGWCMAKTSFSRLFLMVFPKGVDRYVGM